MLRGLLTFRLEGWFFSCILLSNILTISLLAKVMEGSMNQDRTHLKKEDRWNVEALYPSPASWVHEFEKYRGDKGKIHWPELLSFKGKLADPKAAISFFERYFELERLLSKLHTYAHLRMDEDLGNDLFKKDYGLVSSVLHDFQHEYSWIEPELLRLNDQAFHQLISHVELAPYRFYLEKIGRMRSHTLSSELEELMALSGKALESSHRAFSALNNADLTFESAIDSAGEKHPLSNGSYLSYMRHKDRVLRKSAFQNLHRSFEGHANTLCELLQGEIERHLYYAKARKFESCLEAALFPHHIEPIVYENLIASVHRSLSAMHEYVALRKQILGLDELHYYDLMVPLIDSVDISMSYPEACAAVIASTAPLGEKYQNEVKRGLLEDRWVDVYETPRKRSGAYSSGCYDSMPYILMNYQGTLNDVFTLAHEVGHSMHSFLSHHHQPYVYSHYPIFVAEVASTFNEQLLLKSLKSKIQSPRELAYLINYEIEGIRATLFRQTMFAEFELQLHKWAEQGVPLTPALLQEHYMQLNRDYYGPDLVLDKELSVEWARIPHFYYNFYVYQYATGLSASMALFQQAVHSSDVKKQYLEFLSSGGSRYPLDLLQRAGVDMRTTDAIDAAVKRFRELLVELKLCLTSSF